MIKNSSESLKLIELIHQTTWIRPTPEIPDKKPKHENSSDGQDSANASFESTK